MYTVGLKEEDAESGIYIEELDLISKSLDKGLSNRNSNVHEDIEVTKRPISRQEFVFV